jgi:hypothetical protein
MFVHQLQNATEDIFQANINVTICRSVFSTRLEIPINNWKQSNSQSTYSMSKGKAA